MKNNKVLSAVSLLAVMFGAASCGGSEKVSPDSIISDTRIDPIVRANEDGEIIKINDPDDPKNSTLTKITISNKLVHLFYDDDPEYEFYDSENISYTVAPYGASDVGFKFESSDSKIATVDENGKVTAVSEGECDITLSNADGSIKDTAHVIVNWDIGIGSTSKRKNKIIAAQNSISLDTVYSETQYVNRKGVKNGEIQSTSQFTQCIWASKQNAYVRLTASEYESITTDGSVIPSRVEYIFWTDKFGDTYVVNIDGVKKNYLVIDLSEMLDEGKSQFDALGVVLDSFFTSGKKIVTDTYADMLGGDVLSPTSSYKYVHSGYLEDNVGQLAIQYTNTSSGKLGVDDAEDFDLPVGTQITINDDIKYIFQDNLVSKEAISEIISYELDDVEYENAYFVDNYYRVCDKSELYKPDLSTFQQKDSIYDLF